LLSLLPLALCCAVVLALGLGLQFVARARVKRPLTSVTTRQVRVKRARIDSRRLPRQVELGDDLEIKELRPQPVELDETALDVTFAAEELRCSHVVVSYEDGADVDEPTTPGQRIRIIASGETHRGLVRACNEDRLLLLPERSVFAVADGMGGHAGGAVASELAVKKLEASHGYRDFQGHLAGAIQGMPRRARELALSVQMANQAVREVAASTPELRDMGTTLVAARFSEQKQRVYIAHVGDSRCYRLRRGSLRQLTHDHTMASVGFVGPNGARLLRAVGLEEQLDIDVIVDRPQAGDVYCLCSDGLPKMVKDEELRRVLETVPDLPEAVQRLVALANGRGGADNVTVLLVRVLAGI